MKRIGVLGTFVYDEIWHPALREAQPLRQWGGLAYSLSAFAAACPPGARIQPLARIGSDLADPALDFISDLHCIGSSRGLLIVDEPNNRVELRYQDGAERLERLTGGVRGWTLDELLPYTWDLDALYLNFLAGNELDLATAQGLRAALKIPIYADLHSLFLGPPPADGGPRMPLRLEDWEAWLRCFDYVQVNETELGLMGEPRSDPLALLPRLPELGPKLVIATQGGEGATAAVRPDAAEALLPSAAGGYAHFPLASSVTGDPTGCGDVWGSVLFCGLLGGLALDAAVQRAHTAAAAKMRVSRIELIAREVAKSLAPSSAPA